MTKYLLDTQALIWWFEANNRLPDEIKRLLDSKAIIMLSVASLWEIIIKTKSGKLKLGRTLEYLLKKVEFEILYINLNHVLRIRKLPNIHKDPFDRILIAQSLVEKCILLTTDKMVKKYFKSSQ